jgi:hypothetical protein
MRLAALAIAVLLSILGTASAMGLEPKDHLFIFPSEKAADLIKLTCYFPPPGITGYWTPKSSDLAGVEDQLPDYLKIQDAIWLKELEKPEKKFYQRVPLKRDWSIVVCQVTGFERGSRKFLFMNYVSNHIGRELARFVDEPLLVDDGGPYFFRVVYDLTDKKFIWYECNGG